MILFRQQWKAWGLIILCGGLALAARYGLVEPTHMAATCDYGTGPWWCSVRTAIIQSFATYAIGYINMATAVLVLITRTRGAGLLAAIAGAVGLALYCQEPSAISLVLGALVLARSDSSLSDTRVQASS